jgi:hypothetical protein
MKRKIITLSLIITHFLFPPLTVSADGQGDKKSCNNAGWDEKAEVIPGETLLSFESGNSIMQVRVGNRGLSILESLEGNKYDSEKFNRYNDDGADKSKSIWERKARFRGHWAGIELGFNNYIFDSGQKLPDEIAYMDLNSGKSMNFNINFSQLSLGITRHFGLVTGLGLNWNNYKFSGNNNIRIGENGYIDELTPENGAILKKSKFTTLYLTVPAMAEIQLPAAEGHRLNIAAGWIGALKLKSHTKMIYKSGQEIKSYADLNMNLLRGGFTARIGYRNFMLYGTWYTTPWFEDMKGPGRYQLKPFEIGAALTFNH